MKRPIQPSRGMHTGPKNKKPRTEVISPVSCLKSVFGKAALVKLSPKSFVKPDEEDIAAYDMEAVRAVRSCNVEKLKQMFAEGKNINACNQFGESLLHMACRRGDLQMVSFMVREAKVRVDIRDDFGRNPFHDACWTSTPNLDVMDVLIEVADPFMMLSEDVRGSSPFDYARREHFAKWVKYIESRMVTLQAKIKLAQPATTTR
jgi:ankyrin repeat protein